MTTTSLFTRQYGLYSSVSWKRSMSTMLFPTLNVSSTVVAQPANLSPVNCLNLENIEHRYLLSGCGNGGISILDRVDKNDSKSVPIIASVDSAHPDGHKYSVDDVQWYPHDTGMFLSLSADQTVKIWDTNEMQVVDRFKFQSDVLSFSIRSKGKALVAVTSKDKNIYLCDLNTGSKMHTIKGHKSAVFVAKWSPRKESLLVSASSDGCINLWDVRKSNALLMSLTRQQMDGSMAHDDVVNSLCFISDGLKLLSYGHDGAVRAWNMWDGQEISEINYGVVKNDTKRSVQMAVTSCLKDDLVFVPTDCNVEVHVINTGKFVKTLAGHFKNVNCVCYCNAFQELYTGSADCKILQWKNYRYHEEYETFVKNCHEDTWSDDNN